jgi:hypothetical protein
MRSIALPLETRVPVLDRVRRTLAQEALRVESSPAVVAVYSDGLVRFEASGPEPTCFIQAEGVTDARADFLLDRGVTLVSDLVRALGSGDSPGDMWCAPE